MLRFSSIVLAILLQVPQLICYSTNAASPFLGRRDFAHFSFLQESMYEKTNPVKPLYNSLALPVAHDYLLGISNNDYVSLYVD